MSIAGGDPGVTPRRTGSRSGFSLLGGWPGGWRRKGRRLLDASPPPLAGRRDRGGGPHSWCRPRRAPSDRRRRRSPPDTQPHTLRPPSKALASRSVRARQLVRSSSAPSPRTAWLSLNNTMPSPLARTVDGPPLGASPHDTVLGLAGRGSGFASLLHDVHRLPAAGDDASSTASDAA